MNGEKKHWPRNTVGIKTAAHQKAQVTEQRASEAITQLLRQGEPINFSIVARTAGVSTAWLYRNPDIRALIEKRRAEYVKKTGRQPKTPSAKQAVVAHLKRRIQTLEQEKQALQTTVEQLYGENLELHRQTSPNGVTTK